MKLVYWMSLAIALASCPSPIQAQIVPDTTPDNTNTIVNGLPTACAANTCTITGGRQAGTNLFHSFQQFGLNPGQAANFVLVDPATQNVLARVMGGNTSIINGLVQVTGGSQPNLYLMNPAGIIFGAGAGLDVPGSLIVTTANGIGLGDRWFNAIGPNDYANLTGTPDRLAFTMSQPGAIVNATNLIDQFGAPDRTRVGRQLIFVAGTVVSTGTIAPGSNSSNPETEATGSGVTLVAAPGASIVRLSQLGNPLSLDVPVAGLPAGNLPNGWTLPITSLPQLLTGGNVQSASGVTIGSDGQVTLTSSGDRIDNGDIVATQRLQSEGVKLVAPSGDVLVSTIVTGVGGVNVFAGGRFQVRGTVTDSVRDVIYPRDQPAELLNFLQGKQIVPPAGTRIFVRRILPTSIDVRYNALFIQSAVAGGFSSPITVPVIIRFGGATQTIVDQTTTQTYTSISSPNPQPYLTLRRLVQGGPNGGQEGGFYSGLRVDGRILDTPDPLVIDLTPFEANRQFAIVTPTSYQTALDNDGGTQAVNLYRNAVYFSTPLPLDLSGAAGAVILKDTSSNDQVEPSIQSLVFPPFPDRTPRPDRTTSNNRGGGGVNTETAQTVQRQFINQSSVCTIVATGTGSSGSSGSSSSSGDRGSSASRPASCSTTSRDDAQILKILGE